jgi:predicted 3-demethylubiquinone-9 3-methyltransferase (glyoxalase superfamily)
MTNSVSTCLWFNNGRGPEAAAFYTALIPGSRVVKSFGADAGMGAFSVTDFTLAGVPYQILDAGPHFTLTEAVSITVATDDQAETDRLWSALIADGGSEGPCGWCKDRFGLSWQIYPKRLIDLTTSTDKRVSEPAMAAMMKQKKIDIADIEAAVAAVSG